MSQFPVKLAVSGVIGLGLLLGGVALVDLETVAGSEIGVKET